jgi:sporadic carbohydrate cluster 2OG-Fe(II) oxygenase
MKAAIDLLSDPETPYEKIIIVRPAVEAEEKLGSLPGNVEEKLDPYIFPSYYLMNKIIGKEISIQNKLNFSIQLPGEKLSQVPMHTDRAGGHSLFESVLWMSFTNSKATSSMYIVDYQTTLKILEELPEYEISGINLLETKYAPNFKFIDVNPGDCILFSSNLYHGNVTNEEDSSRVSINCRIKSLWAPEYKKYPNERTTGAFYKPFKFSPISIFGSKFINKEPKFD